MMEDKNSFESMKYEFMLKRMNYVLLINLTFSVGGGSQDLKINSEAFFNNNFKREQNSENS